MSTGLCSVKVAVYSTMPRALRGASRMSVISSLCRSKGLSSPLTVPRSCSYAPAAPSEAPPKSGVVLVMLMLVTRASDAAAQSSNTASVVAAAARLRFVSCNMAGYPPPQEGKFSAKLPRAAGAR